MDERTTRLECLRLAIQHYPEREPDTVVARAGQFEKYVIGSGSANTLRLPPKEREPAPKGR